MLRAMFYRNQATLLILPPRSIPIQETRGCPPTTTDPSLGRRRRGNDRKRKTKRVLHFTYSWEACFVAADRKHGKMAPHKGHPGHALLDIFRVKLSL